MFESIDEAVIYWKESYSFIEDAVVTGYKGGYPIVDFTIGQAAFDVIKPKSQFKRIIRRSEMEGGIEVGVSMCFLDTASIDWNPPHLVICGYPEVIQRIIKYII